MTDNQLIDEILQGMYPTIAPTLKHWFESSRFKDFILRYQGKVRKKLKNAQSDEDRADVLYELEIAYLVLSDDRFDLDYEKYGAGNQRAPDFTATFEYTTELNLEIKRIRKVSVEERIDECMREIAAGIRKVPSNLAAWIRWRTMTPDKKLVDRLESSKDEIIRFVETTIHSEEDNLPFGDERDYPIPGLEHDLDLVLSKPSNKDKPGKTSYYGVSNGPIFYTQRESFKFSDAILEKLGQMIPGMINVLVVSSNSITHEREDLLDALEQLRTQDDAFFIGKGFQGVQDFLNQMKRLSGILFRSTWTGNEMYRNLLWCNDQTERPIPEAIRDYLQVMNGPKQAIAKG